MDKQTIILKAKNLHKSLSNGSLATPVLRGLSFDLLSGETCSITGPSGCGKSTLLYLLGLLDTLDDGQIWLDNRIISDTSDRQKTAIRNSAIGFVFQFHFLLPEFSALENIMIPMRKLGQLTEAQMISRATDLLADVGLAEKAQRKAHQLSGGEQQRVAVARALANNPKLILADEPTGNLDAKNSAHVFELLQRFAKERNHAVLIVTHNNELAASCDETYKMRDGVFLN